MDDFPEVRDLIEKKIYTITLADGTELTTSSRTRP